MTRCKYIAHGCASAAKPRDGARAAIPLAAVAIGIPAFRDTCASMHMSLLLTVLESSSCFMALQVSE